MVALMVRLVVLKVFALFLPFRTQVLSFPPPKKNISMIQVKKKVFTSIADFLIFISKK